MMNKLSVFVLSFLLCYKFFCSATPVRRCSGNLPYPLQVQVDDCTTLPCSVTKGKTTNIKVQFVNIKEETNYIESEVQVKVLGIPIPYELPTENKEVCKNLMYGAYCPLYAEEDVTYNLIFPVDDNLVETNTQIHVHLRDSENDHVACFIVDLIVKR